MAKWRLLDGVWTNVTATRGPRLIDGTWTVLVGGIPLPEETGLLDGIDQTLANLGYGNLGDSLPKRLVAFYQANGATDDSIQTAEWQFLRAQGMTLGTCADMWLELFRSLGYADSWHEGMKDFWIRNGGVL